MKFRSCSSKISHIKTSRYCGDVGSALTELAFAVSLMMLLSTGVFDLVGTLEGYNAIAAATYESARLAGVNPNLETGSWQNLADDVLEGGDEKKEEKQSQSENHLKFQKRLRWLVGLYSAKSPFFQNSVISSVSTTLDLSVDADQLPQQLQAESGNVKDVVVARVTTARQGALSVFAPNLDLTVWTPYLFEKKDVVEAVEDPGQPDFIETYEPVIEEFQSEAQLKLIQEQEESKEKDGLSDKELQYYQELEEEKAKEAKAAEEKAAEEESK